MKTPSSLRLHALYAALAATTLALTACGGGGGGGGAALPILPSGNGNNTNTGNTDTGNANTGGNTAPPAAEDDSGVAATCASLTSGTYRYLTSSDASNPTGLLQIKAGLKGSDGKRSAQVTEPGGVIATLVPVDGQACEFTLGDSERVVIGSNGLGLAVEPDRAITLLFPEQTGDAGVTVADLNGPFNRLGWERDGDSSPFTLTYGAINFSNGMATDGLDCPLASSSGSTPCSPMVPGTDIPANTAFVADSAAGGFSGTGGLASDHAYGFKFGSTVTLVAFNANDGSVQFFTTQRAANLPAQGQVSSYWQYQVDTAGASAAGLGAGTTTIDTVDAGTDTVTRHGDDNVTQTLHYNAPLPGYRRRDGVAGVPASGGNPAIPGVSAAIQLPLGSGLTVVSRLGATTPTTPGTGNGFLNLSLNKPGN